jgi:hypothetical protein
VPLSDEEYAIIELLLLRPAITPLHFNQRAKALFRQVPKEGKGTSGEAGLRGVLFIQQGQES